MATNKHHTLEFVAPQEGKKRLAIITLDMAEKSTNVLNLELIEELAHSFHHLHTTKDVGGLIIRSAKEGQFIAGADINEILAVTQAAEAAEKARMGQELMDTLETLPFPTVAVIDGACLGGGLELALACTYRVAGDGPQVKLSLPEVKLGIIPGFGGTQRLPRVVGLFTAMDMILTGRTLIGKRALKTGLVDDMAGSQILEGVAQNWLAKGCRSRKPHRLTFVQKLMEAFPLTRKMAFKKARATVMKQTQGVYPAPLVALEVLEKTYRSSDLFRYDLEAKKVGELVANPVSKALINLFLSTEEIRRTEFSASPQKVDKIGVVGAGVMGGGIMHLLAVKGKWVRLRDIATQAILKGYETFWDLNKRDRRRRKIDARGEAARNALVSTTTDWTGFSNADLVIEAVVENMEIKKKVMAEAASHIRPDAVLASNTSALSITQMASAVPNPGRVIGLHFFNPVHKMPLVEIVTGEQTSEETLATTFALSLAMGKTPVIVKDSPGFLVNRILGVYLSEAARAAEEGVPVLEIEQSMKKFGMPMGPFELMDEVGLDIAAEVGNNLASAFSYMPPPPTLIPRMVKDKRLGKKNKLGFYQHKGKEKILDQKYLADAFGYPTLPPTHKIDNPKYLQLVDRMVLIMVNEGARCLEEKIVNSARDVDIGMVMGTGFAPFRGGLLAYANVQGTEKVTEKLHVLSDRYGKHFSPTAYLLDLAKDGTLF